jgi:ankyrin repeat protein
MAIALFVAGASSLQAADASGKKLYDAVYGLLGKTYTDIPTIQKLVDAGEDVNYVASNGQSVLWTAVSKGDASDTQEMTASRQKFAVDVAKILIAKGVNLNVPDTKTGQTPLVLALGLLNMDCARLLIQSGADPTIPAKSGLTALHLAAYADTKGDIVDAIIKKGVDVNVQSPKDYIQMRPLHFAVRSGNAVAIDILIKAGADIEGGDTYQATPLYYAAYFDKLSAFRTLLESGASLDAKFSTKGTGFMSYWPAGSGDILPAKQDGMTVSKIAQYRSQQIASYITPENLKQIALFKDFQKMKLYTSADATEVDANGAPTGKTLFYLVQKYLGEFASQGLSDLRVTDVQLVKAGKSSTGNWPLRLKFTALGLKKTPTANQGWVYSTVDMASDALDLLAGKDSFDEWTVTKM